MVRLTLIEAELLTSNKASRPLSVTALEMFSLGHPRLFAVLADTGAATAASDALTWNYFILLPRQLFHCSTLHAFE